MKYKSFNIIAALLAFYDTITANFLLPVAIK